MATIYRRRTYRFKLNHNHPYYKQLVEMTKASKNLYNKALYESRLTLFKSSNGLINADTNSSYQILKKIFPKFTIKVVENKYIHNPVRITI